MTVKMHCRTCGKTFICHADIAQDDINNIQCAWQKTPFYSCECKECSIKKHLSTPEQNIVCYGDGEHKPVFIFR
jgi:hypothetical protein